MYINQIFARRTKQSLHNNGMNFQWKNTETIKHQIYQNDIRDEH